MILVAPTDAVPCGGQQGATRTSFYCPQTHTVYRYRGQDPSHRDNVGLRTAIEHQVPVVYVFGVIRAYAVQCAVCRLRQRQLLEAAHILSDTDPRGQPIIPNGFAMCSLHYTAYDTNVIGISPDYVIHVRGDVLQEHDGPMLQHGLLGFEQKPVILPRRHDERPDRGFMEERFDEFKRAG